MEIQERQLEDMSFDELKEYARVLEVVVLGEKEKTTKSEQGVMKTKEEIEEKIDAVKNLQKILTSKQIKEDTIIKEINLKGSDLEIVFNEPVRAIAPGQSLVVYCRDVVILGGIIVG